jgi:sugar phosphate isomerase/epimerase
MGNSASLGYNPSKELEAYGNMVATVHIKDRVLNGATVPLGKGNTDFKTCFSMLKSKRYNGPFIFQVARSANEIIQARKNIKFLQNFTS